MSGLRIREGSIVSDVIAVVFVVLFVGGALTLILVLATKLSNKKRKNKAAAKKA